MFHSAVRVVLLMSIAALFIVQQVYSPLVTVWIALGEYLHCVSYVLLLDLILTNRGLKGLSVKTHVCFLFVHWFRYIDSFFTTHYNHWIFSLKIFYMVVSALLVLSLICLRNTWERKKDTCSLLVLFFLSLLLGSINYLADGIRPESISEKTFHFFWIISHYLQGFAMLPQFVFCYRDPDNKDVLLTSYILVLGTYRLAYAINWIERAYKERFFYISGPLGLGILLLFLGDFLLYKIKHKSFISSLVLRIDDTIDASQQPLLQAVYGGRYERLSLADLASSSSSSSARVPPIEIDLRNVDVVGRSRMDVLSGMSTTANSPVTDDCLEEDEVGQDQSFHDGSKNKKKNKKKPHCHSEGRDDEEGEKKDLKIKKNFISSSLQQQGGNYQSPPLYRLDQDEEEEEVFGIGGEEEEDETEGNRPDQGQEEEEGNLVMLSTDKKSKKNYKKSQDTPQTNHMHRRDEEEEEERRTLADAGVKV